MYRLATMHSIPDRRTDRLATISCQWYCTACSTIG